MLILFLLFYSFQCIIPCFFNHTVIALKKPGKEKRMELKKNLPPKEGKDKPYEIRLPGHANVITEHPSELAPRPDEKYPGDDRSSKGI